VNILSTYNNGSYAIYSGTSMAAPYVAGSAALYKSLHPDASRSEIVYELLSQSAQIDTRCDGKGYGYIRGGDKDNFPEPVLNIRDLIEQ
jgi:subtilisin family serine protease